MDKRYICGILSLLLFVSRASHSLAVPVNEEAINPDADNEQEEKAVARPKSTSFKLNKTDKKISGINEVNDAKSSIRELNHLSTDALVKPNKYANKTRKDQGYSRNNQKLSNADGKVNSNSEILGGANRNASEKIAESTHRLANATQRVNQTVENISRNESQIVDGKMAGKNDKSVNQDGDINNEVSKVKDKSAATEKYNNTVGKDKISDDNGDKLNNHKVRTADGKEDKANEKNGTVSDQMVHKSKKHSSTAENEGKLSGKEGKASDKEGKASDKEGKVSDKEVKLSDKEGKASDKEGKASDKEGKTSDKEGKASDKEGKTSDKEGKGSDKEGKASDKEGKASDKESKASDKEGKASDKESKASDKESKASDKEGKASDKESKASDKEGKASDKGKEGKAGDKESDEKRKASDKEGEMGDRKVKATENKGKGSEKEGKQTEKEDKITTINGNTTANYGNTTANYGNTTVNYGNTTANYGNTTANYGNTTTKPGNTSTKYGKIITKTIKYTTRAGKKLSESKQLVDKVDRPDDKEVGADDEHRKEDKKYGKKAGSQTSAVSAIDSTSKLIPQTDKMGFVKHKNNNNNNGDDYADKPKRISSEKGQFLKFREQDAGNGTRFIVYFILAVISFGCLYYAYHRRRKIAALIFEGRPTQGRTGSSRRSSGSSSVGGYKRLPVDEESLPPLPSSKPESVQNFIY